MNLFPCLNDESLTVEQKIEVAQTVVENLEPVEISVLSNNINGMYTRQIMIPAGAALVGRVHLYDYVDIMLDGEITVITPDETVHYTGFNVLHGKAGRKRFGIAVKDTHWITVHNTPISDGDEFYETLTAPTIEKYHEMIAKASIADYLCMISQMGMNEADVQLQVLDQSTMTDFIDGEVYVCESQLSGKGLYASTQFPQGERICTSLKAGKRTIAGRYCNHSIIPNAKMQFFGDRDIELIALKEISEGEEITTNYRDTIAMLGGA